MIQCVMRCVHVYMYMYNDMTHLNKGKTIIENTFLKSKVENRKSLFYLNFKGKGPQISSGQEKYIFCFHVNLDFA